MRRLSAVLAAALVALVSVFSAYAADSYVTLYGFSFDINEGNEAVIHGFDDRTDKVEIPAKLLGADVAVIDDYAFFGDEAISSVSFDKATSLRKIGTNAFYGCGNISEISLPSALSELGFGAFQDCSNLEAVSFGGTLETIPAQCFYNCVSLDGVVIPDTVKSLESRSFAGCTSLKDIEIPAGVTCIADNAFDGSPNVVIYCYNDSYAMEYAVSHNISYDFIRDIALGDVNLDGQVNISDTTLIQKYLIGQKPLVSYRSKTYSDVNGDGETNIRDATLIQMYIAGLSVPYAIGSI